MVSHAKAHQRGSQNDGCGSANGSYCAVSWLFLLRLSLAAWVCNSALLRVLGGPTRSYPAPDTVALRAGRKVYVPTLALGFAVAVRAKAPVPTWCLAGPPTSGWLVLASRRLAAGMACGCLRFFNVGGNLSACRFQHVVFLAVMVELQRAQEVDQIPCVVGLNGVGE